MFWSIYQGSQIFGSWFGSLLFKFNLNKTAFSLVMSSIALVAALSFLFIRKPYVLENKDQMELGKEAEYYTQGTQSMTMQNISSEPYNTSFNAKKSLQIAQRSNRSDALQNSTKSEANHNLTIISQNKKVRNSTADFLGVSIESKMQCRQADTSVVVGESPELKQYREFINPSVPTDSLDKNK